MAGVLRVSPVFSAVTDRGRDRQLRYRGGVPQSRARSVRGEGAFSGGRSRSIAGVAVLRSPRARGPALVCRQRGGAAVPERRDRCESSGRLAREVRALLAPARGATA